MVLYALHLLHTLSVVQLCFYFIITGCDDQVQKGALKLLFYLLCVSASAWSFITFLLMPNESTDSWLHFLCVAFLSSWKAVSKYSQQIYLLPHPHLHYRICHPIMLQVSIWFFCVAPAGNTVMTCDYWIIPILQSNIFLQFYESQRNILFPTASHITVIKTTSANHVLDYWSYFQSS